MTRRTATGFSLIEIAIVMVIVGLLLLGVFRGQELLVSARVRSMIQQQQDYKAAYLGFLDRFRSPPGDYPNATTNIGGVSTACGPGNSGNGNGNGQIEVTGGESILAWDHLSKSGFLNSVYTCTGNTIVDEGTVPRNAYGGFLQLVFDSNYAGPALGQHNLKSGPNLRSDLLAEIDRKIDDGTATQGSMRGSTYTTGTPTDATCWNATSGLWTTEPVSSNCGAATLF